MIRVHVADNWAALGVNIAIVQEGGGERVLMHFTESDAGLNRMERMTEPGALPALPTLKLDYDTAKALADALVNFFNGTTDERQLRADLEHERKRAERFESAVLRMLDRVTPDGGARSTP